MKKNFTFKFLISVLVLFFFVGCSKASQVSFVSISPALTEIIYAINAQDMLKGVSTACTYPKEARFKEKVGDNFFINTEKILKLKPTYILAMDSSGFMLEHFKKYGITPLCFKYPNIEAVYQNILKLGELTGREANSKKVVENLKLSIDVAKTTKPKKILYLVQATPMVTVGKKSFINDIIEKSGNISVTRNINYNYPIISEEYAISQHPDVIVLSFYTDTKRIKNLFPKSKIVFMTEAQNDIINRPGTRIDKSVEFFAGL